MEEEVQKSIGILLRLLRNVHTTLEHSIKQAPFFFLLSCAVCFLYTTMILAWTVFCLFFFFKSLWFDLRNGPHDRGKCNTVMAGSGDVMLFPPRNLR